MLLTEFPRQPLFENLDHVLMGLKGNFQHGGLGKNNPAGLLPFVCSIIKVPSFELDGGLAIESGHLRGRSDSNTPDTLICNCTFTKRSENHLIIGMGSPEVTLANVSPV